MCIFNPPPSAPAPTIMLPPAPTYTPPDIAPPDPAPTPADKDANTARSRSRQQAIAAMGNRFNIATSPLGLDSLALTTGNLKQQLGQ